MESNSRKPKGEKIPAINTTRINRELEKIKAELQSLKAELQSLKAELLNGDDYSHVPFAGKRRAGRPRKEKTC